MAVKSVNKKNTKEGKTRREIMLKVSLHEIYNVENISLRTSTKKENISIEKRRYRNNLLERKIFV